MCVIQVTWFQGRCRCLQHTYPLLENGFLVLLWSQCHCLKKEITDIKGRKIKGSKHFRNKTSSAPLLTPASCNAPPHPTSSFLTRRAQADLLGRCWNVHLHTCTRVGGGLELMLKHWHQLIQKPERGGVARTV